MLLSNKFCYLLQRFYSKFAYLKNALNVPADKQKTPQNFGNPCVRGCDRHVTLFIFHYSPKPSPGRKQTLSHTF